jgi:hypothetical protein
MRITEKQLRRLIRESIEAMTADYIGQSMQTKGVHTGQSFMTTAMNALADGDPRTAADAVMNALWIDDPSDAAEEELEELLATVQTEEDLATVVATWGNRHFRAEGLAGETYEKTAADYKKHPEWFN